MNFRKKTGLLGCCICLASLFISCGDANEVSDSFDNTKRGDYSLSFQIKTDQSSTSTRTTDSFEGTKEERAVSSVYILLYDATSLNAPLLFNIPINAQTDGQENFNGQDVAYGDRNHFVSKPVSLKKQDYQLIVLINPSAKILAENARSQEDYGTACNTLKDIVSALKVTSVEEFHNSETSFFMCNAGGIIDISASQLEKREEDAINNPVSVPVERILAKISLHNDLTKDEVKLGGKIGAITWGVDVSNKYTYLMRKPGYLITGKQEIGFHSKREEVYAEDPNFDINAEFINNEEKRKEQFNILSIHDKSSFIDCNPSKKENSNYQYILENTMSRNDQNDDNTDPKIYTTQVIIKMIITEPAGMNGVISYYSFYDNLESANDKKWKIFTHSQAVEWFNNGTYPADMVALEQILKQAHEMENSPFNFRKDENKEPTEYVSTSFRLTYHKDGLNVYRVPIEHFGTNDKSKSVQDYGYYGVVRNNIYQLVIKSVNGPGIDSSNEGYISTNITINPWFGREWEEDLKY